MNTYQNVKKIVLENNNIESSQETIQNIDLTINQFK